VTNAIVLLDLVEGLRAEGPILALIPLAAGFNQGSIIAAELGTVVIGGLSSATFLTLAVIPVVSSLVDGFKVRVSRRLAGSTAIDAPAEVAAI
jgi:hypothetical protein